MLIVAPTKCGATTDTGGRTVQALPRETEVTGQDWPTKNYNLQR